MGLGSSVYKMVIDTRQFVDGVTVTRREIALQKQILESVRPVVEKYGDALDVLGSQLAKGLINVEQYNVANHALRAELPENVAAQKDLTTALAESSAIRRSLMTDAEQAAEAERKHMAALAANEQLYRDSVIEVAAYRDNLRQLLATSPEIVAAEKAQAEARRHGQDIIKSLQTDESKFAERRANAWSALQAGAITEQEYQHVLAQSPQLLKAAVEAERQRLAVENEVAAIVSRNVTAQERLDKELQTATTHYRSGALSGEQYAREQQRIAMALRDVAEAERKKDVELQRGLELNKEFLPASTQARQKLAELKAGYAAGHVSAESYRNGVVQLTATQLTAIPVLGRFAGTLASVGPVGIAAAAGLGALAAGYKVLESLGNTVASKITDQIKKIDDLAAKSDTLNVPIGQFQQLAHAADMADIEQQAFSSGTEKMLGSVSKAADGSEKLARVFDKLGLDTKQLRTQDAPSVLLNITQAIDKLPNAADRVRASQAIFGNADFLRLDTKHLERASNLFSDLQGGIDSLDRSNFDALDDAAKEMNLAFDETWKKLTLAVIPALTDAANAALGWFTELNQSDTAKATLREIGDDLQTIVAVGREVPAVIQSWLPSIESVRSAFPKLSLAMDALGGIAGPNLGDQLRKGRELDLKLKPVQDSGADAARKKQEAAAALASGEDDAASSVDDLTRELKKELQVLKDAAEYAGLTKQEITLLKLAEEGASQATRDNAHAMASQVMEFERQKKAAEELEKATKAAAEKAEAAEKKRTDALKQIMEGLDEQAAKLRGGEREQLAYALATHNASEADKAAALAKFDANKAAEKSRDATKLATDAIKDYEKQIRQLGMTADRKKLDDLKVAGVGAEQLKVVDALQKELALREAIHKELNATSDAVRAGSREAADSFARANQLNVRKNYLTQQLPTGGPVTTTTAIPPSPVITSPPSQAINQEPGVTFGERYRLPIDPVVLREKKAAETSNAMLIANLNNALQPVGPARQQYSAPSSMKPVIVQGASEQTTLQKKANELLAKIASKPPGSITVDEVTL